MQTIKLTTATKSRSDDVRNHFKISSMTLWRWEQDPDFPQALRRGRVKMFDIAAIEQWLIEGAK